MIEVTKDGITVKVAKDADPGYAAKVCQFLANSVNGPVFALCHVGSVVVTPARATTADEFRAAAQLPDEREPASSAVEALPVEAPPNVPETLKPKPTKPKK